LSCIARMPPPPVNNLDRAAELLTNATAALNGVEERLGRQIEAVGQRLDQKISDVEARVNQKLDMMEMANLQRDEKIEALDEKIEAVRREMAAQNRALDEKIEVVRLEVKHEISQLDHKLDGIIRMLGGHPQV